MRISLGTVFLCGLLVLPSACAAGSKTRLSAGTSGVVLDHTSPDPSDDPPQANHLVVHTGLDDYCARITVTDAAGDSVSGPPTVLGPGPNSVVFPPGHSPHLTVFWWDETQPSPSGGGANTQLSFQPRNLDTFYFTGFVNPTQLDEENIAYQIKLRAETNNLQQAENRLGRLEQMYHELLAGNDPGNLPNWVDVVDFTSWRMIQSGSDQGSWIFTSAKPGSRVDEFRFEFNGTTIASLDAGGASMSTVGAWQVVQSVVPATEIVIPSAAANALNDFEIVFDTDIGDALLNELEYEIELLP